MDPARPNKAQYIAAVPPADVEMTDADKAGSAASSWPICCIACGPWMIKTGNGWLLDDVGWVDGLIYG